MFNPDNKVYAVEMQYTCGHEEKFESPGSRDPEGVLAAWSARCSDDVIRCHDIVWKCSDCEPRVDKAFKAPIAQK